MSSKEWFGCKPSKKVPGTFWGEAGSLLILSLWLSVFLSSVVWILYGQILAERRAVRAYQVRVEHSIALEIMRARFELALQADTTEAYDTLKDPWAHDETLFGPVPFEKGHYLSLSSGISYGTIDEERLINVNQANLRLLKELFVHAAGLKEKDAELLAASVQDWRDLDVFSSSRELDTEGMAYPHYPCKNDLFESVEELLLVHGMDEGIYQSIRPWVTVYGEGKVNINTAGPEVLRILGAPDSLVEKILKFRAGGDKTEGTEDDGFFEEVGSVEPKLQMQGADFNTEELNALNRMKSEDWIGVRSDFFRLPVHLKAYGKTWEQNLVADRKGQIWEIGR